MALERNEKKYEITYRDGIPRSITHFACGMTSYSPDDIAARYCGHCHEFVGEPDKELLDRLLDQLSGGRKPQ